MRLYRAAAGHGEYGLKTQQFAFSTFIQTNSSEEISAKTLGTSNTIRSDKSVMVDTVSHYVDYIIGSGSELIDIAVPYQPTSDEDKTALKDKLTGLLAEIWDNYVSTTGYTGRRIILLALGFGCHSMAAFMNERQREVIKYVSCVTMVPGDDTLPIVVKKMGPWYYENSFVFLTDDHPYWEKAPTKTNNRAGNLIRSGMATIDHAFPLQNQSGRQTTAVLTVDTNVCIPFFLQSIHLVDCQNL